MPKNHTFRSRRELRQAFETPGKPTYLRREGDKLLVRRLGGEERALPLTGQGAARTLALYRYRMNRTNATRLLVLDGHGTAIADFGNDATVAWDEHELARFCKQWGLSLQTSKANPLREHITEHSKVLREGAGEGPRVNDTDVGTKLPGLLPVLLATLFVVATALIEKALHVGAGQPASLVADIIMAFVGGCLGLLATDSIRRTVIRRRVTVNQADSGLSTDHLLLRALDQRGRNYLALEDDTLVEWFNGNRMVLREPGAPHGAARIAPFHTNTGQGLNIVGDDGHLINSVSGQFLPQHVIGFAAAVRLYVEPEITDNAVLERRFGAKGVPIADVPNPRPAAVRLSAILAVVPYGLLAVLFAKSVGLLGGFTLALVIVFLTLPILAAVLITKAKQG